MGFPKVLGPLLPLLYAAQQYKFHFYVDDTQLYIHLSHKDASSALAKLNICLQDVQGWMSLNKLKFNPEKMNLLSLVLRLNIRRFPPIFLSVFLVVFLIQLILSEI